MSVQKIISVEIYKSSSTKTGTIVSAIREMADDSEGNTVFVADVDLGGGLDILKNVPIACQNRDLFYSDQGKSVALSKINNGTWVISGISKHTVGRTHYIYMTFADDVILVTGEEWAGYVTRRLTFGELGALASSGFGQLPFGVQGRFALNGSLYELMEI